jgi:hypothetical protein
MHDLRHIFGELDRAILQAGGTQPNHIAAGDCLVKDPEARLVTRDPILPRIPTQISVSDGGLRQGMTPLP